MLCYMYHEQDFMMNLLFPSTKWDSLHHDLPAGCHNYDNAIYALMGWKWRVTLEEFLGLEHDACSHILAQGLDMLQITNYFL